MHERGLRMVSLCKPADDKVDVALRASYQLYHYLNHQGGFYR